MLSFSQSFKIRTVYPTTQCSIPEESNPHNVSRERRAVVFRDTFVQGDL